MADEAFLSTGRCEASTEWTLGYLRLSVIRLKIRLRVHGLPPHCSCHRKISWQVVMMIRIVFRPVSTGFDELVVFTTGRASPSYQGTSFKASLQHFGILMMLAQGNSHCPSRYREEIASMKAYHLIQLVIGQTGQKRWLNVHCLDDNLDFTMHTKQVKQRDNHPITAYDARYRLPKENFNDGRSIQYLWHVVSIQLLAVSTDVFATGSTVFRWPQLPHLPTEGAFPLSSTARTTVLLHCLHLTGTRCGTPDIKILPFCHFTCEWLSIF